MITFHFTEKTKHLETVLAALHQQGTIVKYEISDSRREVKFTPFNTQSILKIGIIVGQLEEVKRSPIDNFKKHL